MPTRGTGLRPLREFILAVSAAEFRHHIGNRSCRLSSKGRERRRATARIHKHRRSARYPIEDLAESLAEGIVSGHPDMPIFVFSPQDRKEETPHRGERGFYKVSFGGNCDREGLPLQSGRHQLGLIFYSNFCLSAKTGAADS